MRGIVCLTLGLLVSGCDPARTVAIHNDLKDRAQVSVRFHLPGDGAGDVQGSSFELAPGERKDPDLSWSDPDWLEIAWRSQGRRRSWRFRAGSIPMNGESLHLVEGGLACGPQSSLEALDANLGATKPFLAGAIALLGLIGWRSRTVTTPEER